MLENAKKNLQQWDQLYDWPKDGDEWAGQADACGVSYPEWKQSLVDKLLVPHVNKQTHVLEIAPGHGRWTEHLIPLAGHVTVVDISSACLDFCRTRFQEHRNIDYVLTTGDRLPLCVEGLIDFVWSYDSFVHMDRHVIRAYLGEIRRSLKPGGSAIVHHSSVEHLENHQQDSAPGWRSAMNAALMRELALESGLMAVSQFTYWDRKKKIGAPRYGDLLTELRADVSAVGAASR